MFKLTMSVYVLFFSVWAVFSPNKPQKAGLNLTDDMPMCSTMPQVGNYWGTTLALDFPSVKATPSVFGFDTAKSYTMPLLAQTPTGEVLLSWTEKDDKGMTSFCLAVSKDKGKTFSDKKTIYSGTGIGNSRLMRAKVLTKKDGSLVAFFTNRPDAPPPATTHAQPQTQGQPQAGRGGGGKGGGRSSALVYCVSKDGGNTWTSPQSVDTDPTQGLMRGFFDAIVLPNDEIAVAYLKDVKGSTKHEERDLRLAITKNGVFQDEKLLDAVVCDCCNINLLVDAKGAFHVYYRDNNDDIRDIARITSTDNGATFSTPQIVHNDGWKIAGCPHSGAMSSATGKSALIAWYSGSETESGFRLVTQEGEKLFVLNDPSVKNPFLMGSLKVSALVWEQGKEKPQLVFRTINKGNVSETKSIEGATDAANATGLVIDNQLLIAYEVKNSNKKNGLKVSSLAL